MSSNIDPSKAVSSENVTITRSTSKIKAVIRKRGESHRNRDYLEFGCVAMVTLRDRCSLRYNRVVLVYTRVLSAFWRKKDVFESHSNCNGRRMLCWKSLKLFSSMIHHFNVILDEWMKTFWNGSSFISFYWFCFESNFRKTSEAIEYKNFIILPKKNIGHINTCHFEWTNSVPTWQHSFMNKLVDKDITNLFKDNIHDARCIFQS